MSAVYISGQGGNPIVDAGFKTKTIKSVVYCQIKLDVDFDPPIRRLSTSAKKLFVTQPTPMTSRTSCSAIRRCKALNTEPSSVT